MRIYYNRVLTFVSKWAWAASILQRFKLKEEPPVLDKVLNIQHLHQLLICVKSLIGCNFDTSDFGVVRITTTQTHYTQLINDLMEIVSAVATSTNYRPVVTYETLLEDWFTNSESYAVSLDEAFSEIAQTLQLLINTCNDESDKYHVENVLLGYQPQLSTVYKLYTVCRSRIV